MALDMQAHIQWTVSMNETTRRLAKTQKGRPIGIGRPLAEATKPRVPGIAAPIQIPLLWDPSQLRSVSLR